LTIGGWLESFNFAPAIFSRFEPKSSYVLPSAEVAETLKTAKKIK
jgi:hypothetical protein